ncbi:hypothetical protein [Sphingomonas sp. TZW2008]|uniref:hypothetical protein n=1 Tax=Sphingomonas sp. TZW2008 TaxID=1917973 RepID=UPI00118177E6|nr:hypothetical protein [Sphingomonas sp. TZW2008]
MIRKHNICPIRQLQFQRVAFLDPDAFEPTRGTVAHEGFGSGQYVRVGSRLPDITSERAEGLPRHRYALRLSFTVFFTAAS